MIKLGTNSIGKIYLGSNSIGKAYLGSNLVFQKGSSPTPSIQPVFYDRLVFDGTAYIDTNITPPTNASFVCTMGYETLKAAQRMFVTPASNSAIIGAYFGSSTTSSRRYFSIYYGGTSAASTDNYLSFDYNAYTFFLTPNGFGWGDHFNSFTKGSNAPIGPLVLGQGYSHTGQPYTGKMGVFYVYGSDAQNIQNSSEFHNYTPVYTLRPCTYNGEAGVWCVETSTFYGNTAGAGTLTVQNNE